MMLFSSSIIQRRLPEYPGHGTMVMDPIKRLFDALQIQEDLLEILKICIICLNVAWNGIQSDLRKLESHKQCCNCCIFITYMHCLQLVWQYSSVPWLLCMIAILVVYISLMNHSFSKPMISFFGMSHFFLECNTSLSWTFILFAINSIDLANGCLFGINVPAKRCMLKTLELVKSL